MINLFILFCVYRFTVGTLLLIDALCACPGPSLSQTTSTLRGVIVDPSGSFVSSAKVSAILQETGTLRAVNSDADGSFVIPALQVGRYTLTVEAPGFKMYRLTDIDVTIGHVIEVNPQLALGSTSETVTVQDVSPLVEANSTQLGAVVDNQTVVALPLTRNWHCWRRGLASRLPESDKSWSARLAKLADASEHYDAAKENHIYV